MGIRGLFEQRPSGLRLIPSACSIGRPRGEDRARRPPAARRITGTEDRTRRRLAVDTTRRPISSKLDVKTAGRLVRVRCYRNWKQLPRAPGGRGEGGGGRRGQCGIKILRT